MAFDIEFDWDLLYMQYSTDLGESWDILGSADDPNWYNSFRISGDGVNNNCYNCVGSQWTGTNLEMQEYSYSLAAFSSYENIVFRFVFHTDEYVNEEGVVIDDLVIEGTTLDISENELNQISVYPNPSSDIFNIDLNNISFYNIRVRDITAKLLFSESNIARASYRLDMSEFSNGVYLLEIESGNKRIVKKIILN